MIAAILKGKIWKMREISRILFERTYNGTNVWRSPNGRLRNVTRQRIGQRKTMNISEFITPDELTLLTGRPTGRSSRSTIKFYIFYSDRKGTASRLHSTWHLPCFYCIDSKYFCISFWRALKFCFQAKHCHKNKINHEFVIKQNKRTVTINWFRNRINNFKYAN